MILTVTPNPSVDRTVFLDTLLPGGVNRAGRSQTEPSGKGINVAMALAAHGSVTHAVLPTGGPTGDQLQRMLSAAGLSVTAVPIDGAVRSNISLTQTDGTVTKINEAGPTLTAAEVDTLTDAVVDRLDDADWLVCGGSLPAGAPEDLYARFTELAHRHGVQVAVDSSGAALAASLGAAPDLIKPNAGELALLTAATLRTLGDVVSAAEEVRRRGVGAVLASLGADGAVLVDDTGILYGRAAVPTVVSAVGAGDALLAGYLSAVEEPRRRRLATALQWAAAAVQHEGTLFRLNEITVDVELTDTPDRSRPVAATL